MQDFKPSKQTIDEIYEILKRNNLTVFQATLTLNGVQDKIRENIKDERKALDNRILK